MTPLDRFDAAVGDDAARLGPSRLRTLAARFERDGAGLAPAGFGAEFADAAARITDAARRLPAGDVAAYLRGMATALAHREAAVRVDMVWSGPTGHAVPVRATAQVLAQVVGRARHELLLMTYSARRYAPLRAALASAVARNVRVRVVVETLQGAGSAISGAEPAAAFHGLGVELWHWPVDRRPDDTGRLHAKIAVADRRELLVSSANLTQSGVHDNIEAGLLVRGGTAPVRAAEHVDALCSAGTLQRMHRPRP
ncbi:DISARM system phospholipase D-like protein DrmC [Actinomadura rifamycini]|uniref:DISARM system phospholipase D-like protein DrmC n=1 Tax=Actinomadura rifamycini TaxID=31962 RepID=UPI000429A319|nr:DISARM system phospholipase D-like protein DrmC [Actinomadura rifamycini]